MGKRHALPEQIAHDPEVAEAACQLWFRVVQPFDIRGFELARDETPVLRQSGFGRTAHLIHLLSIVGGHGAVSHQALYARTPTQILKTLSQSQLDNPTRAQSDKLVVKQLLDLADLPG